MYEVVLPALTGFLGVLLGAGLSGFATWQAARLSATAKFEAEKYKQRLRSYRKLWAKTKRLKRTPDKDDATREAMIETLESLDEWYFSTGGLLLTDNARVRYFDLIRKLQASISSFDSASYETVYSAATALRNVTSTEIGGRFGNPFSYNKKHEISTEPI